MFIWWRWKLADDAYPPPSGHVFNPKDQLCAMALSVVLSTFLGGWKRIIEAYEIRQDYLSRGWNMDNP